MLQLTLHLLAPRDVAIVQHERPHTALLEAIDPHALDIAIGTVDVPETDHAEDRLSRMGERVRGQAAHLLVIGRMDEFQNGLSEEIVGA